LRGDTKQTVSEKEVRRNNSSYVKETDKNKEKMNLRGTDELGRNKRKK
jgi:hypothetical protein